MVIFKKSIFRYSGVNQLSISDGYKAGIYGITITQDARQAVAVCGQITMTAADTITKDQEALYLLMDIR